MKQIVAIIFLLVAFSSSQAQISLPNYPDSLFNTYFHQRWTLFKTMPNTQGDIVFLGNSITDGGEWSELFKDPRVRNRGISGDMTAGVLKRTEELASRRPASVFLLIGINDLGKGISPDSVVKNILLVADYLQQESPSTQLYVQSILPVNPGFGKFAGQTARSQQIKQTNELLFKSAALHHYTYIDLHSEFINEQGLLQTKYTNDGLHLTGEGYMHWVHLVYPYVSGLSVKPSLIPMPNQLLWKKGYFNLNKGSIIVAGHPSLQQESMVLANAIQSMGQNADIKTQAGSTNGVTEKNTILLQLGLPGNTNQSPETYTLSVTADSILLSASAPQGIYNGIQTLKQLMRNGIAIDACTIQDSPAFSWRGYMIDVGRNYVSVELLKQQIDVMSRYKLNVFHFHATEDIAWRIAIQQYPQLTAPENMLRNKGMYYTSAEIRELIAYCKARNILFVPEIDMPGHSAAFKRAMKVDMQSDSGLVYIKNILKEICTTYDVPYIHIGADEVKITNPDFIPAITRYIESFGKKVIGWQPGGNFSDNTIRQLWMEDHGKITGNKQLHYIDSRHLYLNHMDPLESVVTIFNRQLGSKDKGDEYALGATICLWNDRAAATEKDLLQMNPVYPAMLAFAERSWRGGGTPGWIANISDGDPAAFTEFEARLMDHQTQSFSELPFPYQKNAHITWKIFGPFDNKGNLAQVFTPEKATGKEPESNFYKEVTGGTIVLRHWWSPMVKGVITGDIPDATWYASTKIWSSENALQPYWIGFNNFSRSYSTDSPPAGEWNDKKAAIWLNGAIVPPPVWKRAGQKGHPDIPLTDEGYEYRTPAVLTLKKGWNTVLIKIPFGKLRGPDAQNPSKYQFTFVQVEK